jgi:hypothetical protein
MDNNHHNTTQPRLIIPISRSRAAERSAWRLLPGAILCALTWLVERNLNFTSSGVTPRITDIAVAIAIAPFAILGLWLVIAGIRQLSAAVWPTQLGVFADPNVLVLNWGPLGKKQYDWNRITAQYFFEMEEPPEDAQFESHLPEEQQLDSFLPVLTHPDAQGPIRNTILRYCAGSERTIAAAFRPLLSRCIRPEMVDDEDDAEVSA